MHRLILEISLGTLLSLFNVYEALLVWDGNLLTIPIDEADSEPLVGMSLMEGYQLTVQVFEDGRVELSKVNMV